MITLLECAACIGVNYFLIDFLQRDRVSGIAFSVLGENVFFSKNRTVRDPPHEVFFSEIPSDRTVDADPAATGSHSRAGLQVIEGG